MQLLPHKIKAKKPIHQNHQSRNFHKKNFQHGNQQRNKFQQNKHSQQKSHVVKSSQHHDRLGGKFQSNSGPVLAERPMKMVTIERPKIIKPDGNGGMGSSGPSVFHRLGKAGTVVTFRNLNRSVQQADIHELCRAVGDVKDVQMQVEKGLGVARVTFGNDRDAAACVAKYHGLTLDNLEMQVTMDRPTTAANTTVKSVFSRIDNGSSTYLPTELIQQQQGKNIRSGLFGTALQADDDEDEDGEMIDEDDMEDEDDDNEDEMGDDEEVYDDDEEEEEEEEEEEDDGGIRQVTMRSFGGRGRGRGGGRGRAGRGGGRGGRGGRFNNRRRNTQGGSNRRGPVDEGALDNELDAYMANR